MVEPGKIIGDRGCQSSVAGAAWHLDHQACPAKHGYRAVTSPKDEIYIFGDGAEQ